MLDGLGRADPILAPFADVAAHAHILFDLVGTLVEYDPSRTAQDYRRTHDTLIGFGLDLGSEDFLAGCLHAYLAEWNVGVRHPEGMAALLGSLGGRYRSAVGRFG